MLFQAAVVNFFSETPDQTVMTYRHLKTLGLDEAVIAEKEVGTRHTSESVLMPKHIPRIQAVNIGLYDKQTDIYATRRNEMPTSHAHETDFPVPIVDLNQQQKRRQPTFPQGQEANAASFKRRSRILAYDASTF